MTAEPKGQIEAMTDEVVADWTKRGILPQPPADLDDATWKAIEREVIRRLDARGRLQ